MTGFRSVRTVRRDLDDTESEMVAAAIVGDGRSWTEFGFGWEQATEWVAWGVHPVDAAAWSVYRPDVSVGDAACWLRSGQNPVLPPRLLPADRFAGWAAAQIGADTDRWYTAGFSPQATKSAVVAGFCAPEETVGWCRRVGGDLTDEGLVWRAAAAMRAAWAASPFGFYDEFVTDVRTVGRFVTPEDLDSVFNSVAGDSRPWVQDLNGGFVGAALVSSAPTVTLVDAVGEVLDAGVVVNPSDLEASHVWWFTEHQSGRRSTDVGLFVRLQNRWASTVRFAQAATWERAGFVPARLPGWLLRIDGWSSTDRVVAAGTARRAVDHGVDPQFMQDVLAVIDPRRCIPDNGDVVRFAVDTQIAGFDGYAAAVSYCSLDTPIGLIRPGLT